MIREKDCRKCGKVLDVAFEITGNKVEWYYECESCEKRELILVKIIGGQNEHRANAKSVNA